MPNSVQPDTIRPANTGSLLTKGELEQMARKRYQDPEPELIGNWWYIRVRRDFFEDGEWKRRQVRHKLCGADKKVREVKKLAAAYLQDRINQGFAHVGGGMTLNDYVDKRYNITELPLLAKPTQNAYEGMIENYIKPVFGEKCLGELDVMSVQAFFSGMVGKGVEHPTREKIRNAFGSVLRSAKKYRLIDHNPIDDVTLPPDKRGKKQKFVVTPEQFDQIVARISEPYATMVYVALWTGLRVSELCGLKWRCVGESSITIEERYYRGDWSVPKSQHSAAMIDVLPSVIERINSLKGMTVRVKRGTGAQYFHVVKKSGPDDLVFQSVRKGVEMNDHNILSRHIKPAGRALGLEQVNWHCLRRSFLTWAIEAGVDPKVVQALARHSRVTTTLDIYAQVMRGAQKRGLEKLSQYVVTNLSQKNTVDSGQKQSESTRIQ